MEEYFLGIIIGFGIGVILFFATIRPAIKKTIDKQMKEISSIYHESIDEMGKVYSKRIDEMVKMCLVFMTKTIEKNKD